MTIESTTTGRCRTLECEAHDHTSIPQLFCHEWLPYPIGTIESCSVCRSVFEERHDHVQKTLGERRDRIERRAKLSVDLREAITVYLLEYGVAEKFATGAASDVLDETLNETIDEYGDGS